MGAISGPLSLWQSYGDSNIGRVLGDKMYKYTYQSMEPNPSIFTRLAFTNLINLKDLID